MPLMIALVCDVLARAVLIVRTNAMIDGDEGLVGIQAERILHGQFPIYFYAQPYMGSLEAYLAAALFSVTGPSNWALRAVPLALSLVLVYLTWRLALALLPKGARMNPLLAGLAALAAAVPPLYDAVAELRAWGGQIEVYVVTVALLLATVELADRLRANAKAFELTRRWAVLGLLAGLGIWINPLVSYALVACALWLLPPLVTRLRAGRMRALAPLAALLPGVAIGGFPAWIYAAQHSGENLLMYINQPSVNPAVSGAARHGRVFLGAAITARYLTCVAPRVLDGGLPTESAWWLPLRYALLLLPLTGIVSAVWLVRRGGPARLRVGLPLLYAGVVSAVFSLGTSAWGATKGRTCEFDYAGRYAVPVALVAPFLLLALFSAPRVWEAWKRRRQPDWRLTERATRTGWSLALLALLLAGGLQFATYGLADPTTIFESPYYRHIALDQRPLLSYLKAHDIHYAWANHWIGNIVTFETNGGTTCADYYDQVYLDGLQRPPGAIETVSAAAHPSFILIVVDPHPLLARELDAQGIPYTLTVLPASGVTVITPARTVDPATVVDGLREDYAY